MLPLDSQAPASHTIDVDIGGVHRVSGGELMTRQSLEPRLVIEGMAPQQTGLRTPLALKAYPLIRTVVIGVQRETRILVDDG